MKNINIKMNVVLPVTNDLIVSLLEADTVNNRIFYYMAGGKGYPPNMRGGYYESNRNALPPAEDVYGGIIIRPIGNDGVEAVLLEK